MPQKIVPLVRETYLAMIRNSVGSKLFRNFYAEVDGERQDIMRDGDLSCAFFVSAILTLCRQLDRIHGTVGGVVSALEQAGWQKVPEPREGDVVVWAAKVDERGESHEHVGFYLGEGQAVSNSSVAQSPAIHAWDSRPVTAIYQKEF